MLNSPIVLITGVSSGIGRATAELFAKKGFTVFGTVRNMNMSLPIDGVELLTMNLIEEDSIHTAVQSIIDKVGRIDILVNNAGASLIGAVEETSIEEALALFQTNFFGMLRVIKAVLPHMRAKNRGRIINVSSVLGFLPAPYMALYSASKHAVEGLSESLDHEVRQFGIRVSLVEPAFTKTRLDQNSAFTLATLALYNSERDRSSIAVFKQISLAPEPVTVAKIIYKSATKTWRMRYTPTGDAALLAVFRRFMPYALVSSGIRKIFGLS